MNDAFWVGCRAKPGTDSDGTVFIIGHSWTGGRAVFNGLQNAKVGDSKELTTPSGRVLGRVPGRLVLVTCLLGPSNTATNENFIVQAQLVAARGRRGNLSAWSDLRRRRAANAHATHCVRPPW